MFAPAKALVQRRRSRKRDVYVSIYRADEAGLDESGGNFVTVCERHHTACNHLTLTLARQHAPHVEWCEECSA